MLGVSYLGGISRSTTAVLFEVNENPVIVFVDRENSQQDGLLTKTPLDSAIYIHKTKRDGLVFYEVSSLDEPAATMYFQLKR